MSETVGIPVDVSIIVPVIIVPSVGVEGVASEFIVFFFLFFLVLTVVVPLRLVLLYFGWFLEIEGCLKYIPCLLHIPVFLHIYSLRIVVDIVWLYGYKYVFPYGVCLDRHEAISNPAQTVYNLLITHWLDKSFHCYRNAWNCN